MTILEQRFLETVPSELRKLNENLSKITTLLEGRRTTGTSSALQDSILSEESIRDSKTAADFIREDLQNLDHEEVWILLMTSEMKPIRKVLVNIGNLHESCIDTRRITKTALESNSTALILYHNHPSGNPQPSKADVKQTKELRDALKVFDISLTDHIIISNNSFYSFADEKEQKI